MLDGTPAIKLIHTTTASPLPLASSASSVATQRIVAPEASTGLNRRNSSPTEVRAAIFDSPRVLDAVRRVRLKGTPDEKGWAAQLLRECYGYVSKDQQRYLLADVHDVDPRRLAAFGALQERCSGVGELDWATRREITSDLMMFAAASKGDLPSLESLKARHQAGDTRWTQADSKLIANALYGDDALTKREGFLALWTAIDEKAPGGSERRDALLNALANSLLNPPLSEFERLQQCAIAGLCERAGPADASSPGRLQSLYTDAFARRVSPEEILTIR